MWSIWTIIKYLKVVINVNSKRKLFVLQHWRNWEKKGTQLSLQVEIWCLNFSIFDRNTSVKRFPSQSLVDVWDESIDEKRFRHPIQMTWFSVRMSHAKPHLRLNLETVPLEIFETSPITIALWQSCNEEMDIGFFQYKEKNATFTF